MGERVKELLVDTVRITKERSEWSIGRILRELGISRRSYHRWVKELQAKSGLKPKSEDMGNVYKILPLEHDLIIEWAIKWPNLRHRELAWKLVDSGIVCVSPSVVYRVLKEAGLIKKWDLSDGKNYRADKEKAKRPNQRWQTDICYVKIGRRYYLVFFIDEYSRYIVHWELLLSMDGDSVGLAAQVALDKCKVIGLPPEIQSDNGSAYISRDFKMVLSQMGVGHQRIHPHCPEENGIVERTIRTIKEKYTQMEFESLEDARDRITNIIRWYNEERLHSALHFLRPIDYYKGNPDELLEIRRQKLTQARQKRKEKNLELRKYKQTELSTIASSSLRASQKARSAEAHVDNFKNEPLEGSENRNFSKGSICATFS